MYIVTYSRHTATELFIQSYSLCWVFVTKLKAKISFKLFHKAGDYFVNLASQ